MSCTSDQDLCTQSKSFTIHPLGGHEVEHHLTKKKEKGTQWEELTHTDVRCHWWMMSFTHTEAITRCCFYTHATLAL